jgi:predicted Zn-dependent peptidase
MVINISCPENKFNDTVKIINKYFGIIKKKKKIIKYPLLINNNNNIKIIQIKNKVVDNNTIINIYTYMNIKFLSKENLILKLLNIILFNFEIGIFYKELREKSGLVYSIKLYDNISIKNSKESYYNIVTTCSINNVPLVINKIFTILNNYKITNEEISYAKKKLEAENEYDKFYTLESYHSYQRIFLLYNIPFKSKKEVLDDIKNIKDIEIQQFFDIFKKKIINSSYIFYYSSRNIDKLIRDKMYSIQK